MGGRQHICPTRIKRNHTSKGAPGLSTRRLFHQRAHEGTSGLADVPLVVELGQLRHERILVEQPHGAGQRWS